MARLTRLWGAQDGAAAVEFAMVGLPFVMLLFGIIELAMIFLLSVSLDNATATASRTIRTGQMQTSGAATAAAFKTSICNNLGWLSGQCGSNLNVDVRTYASFGNIALTDPITTTNGVKTLDSSQLQFTPGAPQNIVVVRAYYTWTLITPLLSQAVQKLSGGKTLVTSTVAFRNEPYS